MKTLFSVCIVFLAIATEASSVFGQGTENSPRDLKLSSGMYAVLRMDGEAETLHPVGKNQRIAKYVRDVNWGDTEETSISYLLLNAKPDVPLRLAAAPVVVKDKKGEERLDVRLVGDGSEELFRFTEKHLGCKAAVVVEGQVVFLATIRSPIRGPELQVSFCKSGGAKQMKAHLTKLLKKTTR